MAGDIPTEVLAVGRGTVADPLVDVAHVEDHDAGFSDRREHGLGVDQNVAGFCIDRKAARFRRGRLRRDWQAGRFPGVEATVEDLRLGIAEEAEDIVAAARLAEAGAHRLLVDDGRFRASETCLREGVGELLLEFAYPVRRRRREIGEYLVHIDCAGNVPRRIGLRRPRVDHDRRVRLHGSREICGRNQYIRHDELRC